MGDRRNRKLLRSAAPLMRPGERVELITLAKLGTAPVAKTLAVGMATSLLGGGVGFVGYMRRAVYLLLTDRQLMFFECDPSTGGPGELLAVVPRRAVVCAPPVSSVFGLFVKLRLGIEGMSEPLLLAFAPLPPLYRKLAHQLAAALPRPMGR